MKKYNKYITSLCVAFSAFFIFTCELFNTSNNIYMSDDNFVEFGRQYSPDSSKIILNYGRDHGALGYGKAGKAILSISDTLKELSNLTIKKDLIKVHWINNNLISAYIDLIPYIRSGKSLNVMDEAINGVKINIKPYDYIENDFKRIVECRLKSPNNKLELVAYRYSKSKNELNFVHVSIIETNKSIPKYGNYFIADMQSDYIFDANWLSDNKVIFYTNDKYYDLAKYYFVNDKPNVEYVLEKDNSRFSKRYRWQKIHQ